MQTYGLRAPDRGCGPLLDFPQAASGPSTGGRAGGATRPRFSVPAPLGPSPEPGGPVAVLHCASDRAAYLLFWSPADRGGRGGVAPKHPPSR